MTDRITNADVPRMLREMSPAARAYADAVHVALWDLRDRGLATETSWLAGQLFGALSHRMTEDERERCSELDYAIIQMLDERYEIRDRWGT